MRKNGARKKVIKGVVIALIIVTILNIGLSFIPVRLNLVVDGTAISDTYATSSALWFLEMDSVHFPLIGFFSALGYPIEWESDDVARILTEDGVLVVDLRDRCKMYREGQEYCDLLRTWSGYSRPTDIVRSDHDVYIVCDIFVIVMNTSIGCSVKYKKTLRHIFSGTAELNTQSK